MTEDKTAEKYYVYIITTENGKFYTGQTNNLQRRLSEHQGHKPNGAKFVRAFGFVSLAYTEHHATRSEVMRREHEIKRLSHTEKQKLIDSIQAKNV